MSLLVWSMSLFFLFLGTAASKKVVAALLALVPE